MTPATLSVEFTIALFSILGIDNVFKDVESIPLGVDFRKHLADSVGRCHVVLAVIGTRWLVGDAARAHPLAQPGDFVRMEIQSALDRDVPIIPVLVEGGDAE